MEASIAALQSQSPTWVRSMLHATPCTPALGITNRILPGRVSVRLQTLVYQLRVRTVSLAATRTP